MRKVIKFFLPTIFILSACGTYFSDSDKTGSIGIAVEWPKTEISKSLRIKEIPADTVKITVEITGEGITGSPMTPIIKEVKRPETTLLVDQVPTGKKNILAKAENNVLIEDKKRTRAEITLACDSCFKITEQSLEELKKQGLEEIAIQALNSIINKDFTTKEEFEKILANFNLSTEQKDLIMKYAKLITDSPLIVSPGTPNIDIDVENVVGGLDPYKPQIIEPKLPLPTPSIDIFPLPLPTPSNNIFPLPIPTPSNNIFPLPTPSPSVPAGGYLPPPNSPPQIVSFSATPTTISGGGYTTLLVASVSDETSSVSYNLTASTGNANAPTGTFSPATGNMTTGANLNYGSWTAPVVNTDTVFLIELKISDGEYTDKKSVNVTVKGGAGTLNTGSAVINF